MILWKYFWTRTYTYHFFYVFRSSVSKAIDSWSFKSMRSSGWAIMILPCFLTLILPPFFSTEAAVWKTQVLKYSLLGVIGESSGLVVCGPFVEMACIFLFFKRKMHIFMLKNFHACCRYVALSTKESVNVCSSQISRWPFRQKGSAFEIFIVYNWPVVVLFSLKMTLRFLRPTRNDWQNPCLLDGSVRSVFQLVIRTVIQNRGYDARVTYSLHP